MTQKTQTVRIARELIEPLENLVKHLKDKYGMPVFTSKTDAATQAVKEFLDKHSKKREAGS